MSRMIHLCRPIYRHRELAFTTTGNVTAQATFTGAFDDTPQTGMDEFTSGSLQVFDMSPRSDDEIIGWRPVCGAPDRMGMRKRRFSDGISCKRCPRTHVYRKFHKRSTDA